jgi:hypothetical protein
MSPKKALLIFFPVLLVAGALFFFIFFAGNETYIDLAEQDSEQSASEVLGLSEVMEHWAPMLIPQEEQGGYRVLRNKLEAHHSAPLGLRYYALGRMAVVLRSFVPASEIEELLSEKKVSVVAGPFSNKKAPGDTVYIIETDADISTMSDLSDLRSYVREALQGSFFWIEERERILQQPAFYLIEEKKDSELDIFFLNSENGSNVLYDHDRVAGQIKELATIPGKILSHNFFPERFELWTFPPSRDSYMLHRIDLSSKDDSRVRSIDLSMFKDHSIYGEAVLLRDGKTLAFTLACEGFGPTCTDPVLIGLDMESHDIRVIKRWDRSLGFALVGDSAGLYLKSQPSKGCEVSSYRPVLSEEAWTTGEEIEYRQDVRLGTKRGPTGLSGSPVGNIYFELEEHPNALYSDGMCYNATRGVLRLYNETGNLIADIENDQDTEIWQADIIMDGSYVFYFGHRFNREDRSGQQVEIFDSFFYGLYDVLSQERAYFKNEHQLLEYFTLEYPDRKFSLFTHAEVQTSETTFEITKEMEFDSNTRSNNEQYFNGRKTGGIGNIIFGNYINLLRF